MAIYTRMPINQVINTSVGTALGRVTASAAGSCCCPSCGGLECLDRTRFFAGQLLTEADLNNEQSYWLAKSRLHNRYLVGWGVVCGMQVSCGACDGWVVVQPGYAIDPCGNDIIVCEAQNFNVLKAIQECCAPAKKQPANCSPLRYNPDPACKEGRQEWCITIRYREQASRLVTPLTKATSQSSGNCTCGCGCDPGSGGGAKSGVSSSASSASASSSSSSNAACEPTRIVEGFELGVVPASEVAGELESVDPSSLLGQIEQCVLGLVALAEQAPNIDSLGQSGTAYTAVCNFYAAVQNYFVADTTLTRCVLLDELALIKIKPDQETAVYVGNVAALRKLIAGALLDCFCSALVPPCRPAPCDDRIVLACVTIQNGRILDICHFPGRQQLITLQTLAYWLGPLGLDRIGLVLEKLFADLCCGAGTDQRVPITNAGGGIYDREMLTTAGFTSAADINRMATHYIAQAIGARALNVLSPNAQAVDLSILVNKDSSTVAAALKEQGFTQVTMKAVDDDPAWTAAAVDSSAQFAPTAVSAGQPLLVYTKGSNVVGFDVVDSATVKMQDMQNQINLLKVHLNLANATPADASGQANKP